MEMRLTREFKKGSMKEAVDFAKTTGGIMYVGKELITVTCPMDKEISAIHTEDVDELTEAFTDKIISDVFSIVDGVNIVSRETVQAVRKAVEKEMKNVPSLKDALHLPQPKFSFFDTNTKR